MEYFNNILCITQPELLEVMSESNYKQMVRRGKSAGLAEEVTDDRL